MSCSQPARFTSPERSGSEEDGATVGSHRLWSAHTAARTRTPTIASKPQHQIALQNHRGTVVFPANQHLLGVGPPRIAPRRSPVRARLAPLHQKSCKARDL